MALSQMEICDLIGRTGLAKRRGVQSAPQPGGPYVYSTYLRVQNLGVEDLIPCHFLALCLIKLPESQFPHL